MEWQNLLEPVKALAREAGELMTKAGEVTIHVKGEQDFVTETDLAVNDLLVEQLTEIFPEGKIFTEESDDHTLSKTGYTWILDPIDGTSNYIFDLQLSCVSIGLLYQQESILGVVYNPYTKEMFYATKGGGAFLNGEKITVNPVETVKDSIILCETNPYGDRTTSETQAAITRVFQHCIDYRVLGSAALDICYIACGRGTAFMSEGISPWDYAAGEVILKEAGGKSTRWDNSPLTYQGMQSYLASNIRVHDEMLSYL